ncbi:hypothetical protein KDL01_03660, partial [Actinospica durhamensis]
MPVALGETTGAALPPALPLPVDDGVTADGLAGGELADGLGEGEALGEALVADGVGLGDGLGEDGALVDGAALLVVGAGEMLTVSAPLVLTPVTGGTTGAGLARLWLSQSARAAAAAASSSTRPIAMAQAR